MGMEVDHGFWKFRYILDSTGSLDTELYLADFLRE